MHTHHHILNSAPIDSYSASISSFMNWAAERIAREVEDNERIKAKATGNLFIEYESRGNPSGIATSEADYWCFHIGHLFILIETEELKSITRPLLGTKADLRGGDNNSSKGVLLPLIELIKQ